MKTSWKAVAFRGPAGGAGDGPSGMEGMRTGSYNPGAVRPAERGLIGSAVMNVTRLLSCALLVVAVLSAPRTSEARPLQAADYLKTRSVAEVRVSPDGSRIAYAVSTNDGPGRPKKQLFVVLAAGGTPVRLGGEEPASDPEWSPDGQWLAFQGTSGARKGLMVSRPDGSGARFLAEMVGTNSPLTF